MSKIWKCDFEDCEEVAQWYRRGKGRLVKLCTKHEVYLSKQHWGKRVDFSELNEEDIRYLEGKERRAEFTKRHPFDVRFYPLEDKTTKIAIRDRQTGEWRSFIIKDSDIGKFGETYSDLERKGFSPKPSIDDYVKTLKEMIPNRKNEEDP
jgi:hypothetical protein